MPAHGAGVQRPAAVLAARAGHRTGIRDAATATRPPFGAGEEAVRGYRPRTVRMTDSTAGRSGAFGASLRMFSKYTAIWSMRLIS